MYCIYFCIQNAWLGSSFITNNNNNLHNNYLRFSLVWRSFSTKQEVLWHDPRLQRDTRSDSLKTYWRCKFRHENRGHMSTHMPVWQNKSFHTFTFQTPVHAHFSFICLFVCLFVFPRLIKAEFVCVSESVPSASRVRWKSFTVSHLK